MEESQTAHKKLTLDELLRQTMQRTIDEKLPEMLENAVEKAAKEAVEDAFRWGEARKAIRDCVDAVLVPAVENANIDDLNTKLTSVLTQVFEQTTIADTRNMLQNFAGLMVEDEGPVKASELLRLFSEQCAYDLDCEGRQVNFECGDPQYESFEVEAELNELQFQYNYSGHMQDAVLELRINDEYATDKDAEDEMCREIRLWRLDGINEPGQWRVSASATPQVAIRDLRRMSKLDVVLMRMDQGRTCLLDDLSYRNDCIEVTPASTPEVTVE